MNILMPMAGEGLRLQGYSEIPKPLIKINDYSMFLWALQKISLNHEFIFIVQDDHISDYEIDKMIHKFYPTAKIIAQEQKLSGAVMSTLLAKDLIDTDEPLIIVDCDIFVNLEYDKIFDLDALDGALLVSKNTSSAYSYVSVKDGLAVEVAEKKVISDNAISGVYFWKRGSDYVKYANQMIDKGISINGEFYVAPVFNEAIKDNKRISVFETETFYHLGTEEDIKMFLGEPE
jgi:choline kinase